MIQILRNCKIDRERERGMGVILRRSQLWLEQIIESEVVTKRVIRVFTAYLN